MIVDLPGMQKPRDLLTERMQTQVERELKEADAVLFMLNGEQAIGAGDRFIAKAIKRAGIPAVTVLNKVDRLKPHEIAAGARAGRRAGRAGRGLSRERRRPACTCPRSSRELVELMPEGPPMYPAEQRTDLPENVRLAELIREQALLRTRQEVPHAVEVEIDEVEPKEDGSVVVRALLWTETESQKGILSARAGGWSRRSAPPRAPSSRPSWGARSTWTCRSACAADGAATRRCSTAWASNRTMLHDGDPLRRQRPRPVHRAGLAHR